MEELVQTTVEEHDKYQLEFKFNYALLDGAMTDYTVVSYLFFPKSFGINRFTYTKTDYYHNIQNYVRLKTPRFLLAEIRTSAASPLLLLQQILADPAWVSQPDITERLISNFKFLRAILKVSLDDEFASIQAGIVQMDAAEHPSDTLRSSSDTLRSSSDTLRSSSDTLRSSSDTLCSQIDAMLNDSTAILDSYRDLGPALRPRNVDARVLRSFRLTDEALSLLIESVSLATLRLLQKQADEPDELCTASLIKTIQNEQLYRKSQHYKSVLEPDTDAGEFLFRTAVLKKFTSNVLYLSTSVHREGETVEQILYALAAGISMIFATITAFYAQRRYGNFTLPLFIALVVGYMFKDRIKDAMRALSNRFLRRALYDRRTRIHTLDGAQKVGYLRERVLFIEEEAVPAVVMRARNRQRITELDNDGQGEDILRYEKRVRLRGAAVRQLYANTPEVSGVKDIMRLDIRDYLRKMDDPTQIQLYLKDERVRRVRLPRVYFFNIVQIYYAAGSNEVINTSRIRVTLTRKGIRRVELFE